MKAVTLRAIEPHESIDGYPDGAPRRVGRTGRTLDVCVE